MGNRRVGSNGVATDEVIASGSRIDIDETDVAWTIIGDDERIRDSFICDA